LVQKKGLKVWNEESRRKVLKKVPSDWGGWGKLKVTAVPSQGADGRFRRREGNDARLGLKHLVSGEKAGRKKGGRTI